MKTLFFLFSMGFAALLGIGAAKWKAGDFVRFDQTASIALDAEFPFVPTEYPLEDLPFVIIAIGRNNGAFLEKTIQSVLSQNYSRYRFLYIDDASSDGSDRLAKECIEKHPHALNAVFLRNESEKGILASLYSAVQSCLDQEIIVVLHAEDWFAHEWVLQKLNQYHADPDLWLTCCQCMSYPSCEQNRLRPFLQSGIRNREGPIRFSRMHTFYASLFKQIDQADFLYQGAYIHGAGAAPYMLPMLEMGEEHSYCLPEVLYIANEEGTSEEESIAFFERYIRSLPCYEKQVSLWQAAEESF